MPIGKRGAPYPRFTFQGFGWLDVIGIVFANFEGNAPSVISPHLFRDHDPEAGMLLAVHDFQEVNPAAHFIAAEMKNRRTGR